MSYSRRRLSAVASTRTSNVDKKSADGERAVQLCNYVDVYKNDRITSQIEFMQATATPGQIGAFALRAGDTVITKDSETADDIGVPAYVSEDIDRLICGYHLAIVRPDRLRADPRFVYWALRADESAQQWAVLATGVTRVGLRKSDIGKLSIPVPPLELQTRIADFLDHETAQIDELIGRQNALIELLGERRKAVVERAVTRGVDTTAPMKPSGALWLGIVPEHWSILPVGRLYREVDTRCGTGSDLPLLSVSIHRGVLPRDEMGFDKEPRADDMSNYKRVNSGDVVLNRMRAFQGGLGESKQAGIVSPDYMVIRPRPEQVTGHFLASLMRTQWFVEHMSSRLRGIGTVDQGNARTPRINPRDLAGIVVAVPPLSEQRSIGAAVDSQMFDLDALTQRASRAVELLRERRSALITAAVTGKIDVRGAA